MSRRKCSFGHILLALSCMFSLVQSVTINLTLTKENGTLDGRDGSVTAKRDCGYYGCQKDKGLSPGEVAAIVFSVMILFIIIPVVLCFCCAWCCFKSRRRGQIHTVTVAAPIVPQYQQHSYNIMQGTNNPAFVTHNYAYPYHPNQQQPVHGQGQHSALTESPYPRQLYATNTTLNANAWAIYEQPPPYNEATSTMQNTNTSMPPMPRLGNES